MATRDRRPGLVFIVTALRKKHPDWSGERVLAMAKELWSTHYAPLTRSPRREGL